MQFHFTPERNQTTQPIATMPVFNNPEVVADGWYFVSPSKDLRIGKAISAEICGQQLVLFRGEDGKARALDAFCPHMGTHLGVGHVEGNQIRCFFHHWRFDEKGKCTDIPCQKNIPDKAKLRTYPVIEKYDSIWIHPQNTVAKKLADFPELQDCDLTVSFGNSYFRSCHHHVTMINGIDPQHLKTVHKLNIEMDLLISEESDGRLIDIRLSGDTPKGTWKEKIIHWIIGPHYAYSMRYDHANNGLLTIMQDVRLFGGRYSPPTLHMIFAYRPLTATKTLVQPIYVTKKRDGFLGTLISSFLIYLTQRAFYSLQSEDGKVYENMRFFPANLLPIDKPVAQYIQYVNKIPLSPWKVTYGTRD